MNESESRTVLVTGAAGFIGKAVVQGLCQAGWHVKAMWHGSPGSLTPSEALEMVQADMRDEASLRRAVAGAAVVVHLAAAKADEFDSEDVNVGGAKRLVKACEAQGCARLINVSTQSAGIARKGLYARTKLQAEEVFNKSRLRVTNLRPSLVYGEEEGGVFSTVLGFVQRLPVVPVLGDGRWLSAPIHVDDVSRAIIACIDNDRTVGTTYLIGGPEIISFDELINRMCIATGVRRRKLHIPFWLSLWAARILKALWPKCPITVSNVLGSNQNVELDIEPARRDFGFKPLEFERGLALALRARRSSADGSAGGAEEDFRLIARYLLGVEPPAELVNRYAAAQRKLLGDERSAEWEAVRRHPRLLPYLDAATGIWARESLLRRKLLLAAAVLEASPLYAEFFINEIDGRLPVIMVLGWQGARGAIKLVLGLPLLLALRRK